MSGLEVFAAIAAVVSAFHGGAELVNGLKKKKWRRNSKAQHDDEAERKKLKVSLETAESQISFRYAADMNKLGDIVRVGDVIARDRLLHIAVVIQTDIIMSLQLAVKYENAVLDLKVLHEASIMNRKDTIEALDELKQRILLKEPLSRTLSSAPEVLNNTRTSTESVQPSRSVAASPMPDNYIPKAVSLPAGGDLNIEKSGGLARYFSMARKDSKSSNTGSNPSFASASDTINFHPALNYLLRGKGPEERKAIMKDIDEIIAAYQGLSVQGDRADALASLTGQHEASKRDTLAVLHGGLGYQRDTMGLNRDAIELLNNMTPKTGELQENSEYPAYTHNILVDPNDDQSDHRLSEWIDRPMPAPLASRWSTTSAGSSIYSVASDHTVTSDPPSLYRNDSNSSSLRASPVFPDEPFAPQPRYAMPHHPNSTSNSVYSTVPFWPMNGIQPPPTVSLATSRSNSPVPSQTIAPPLNPWAAQQRPRTPIEERQEKHQGFAAGRTRVHLVPSKEWTCKADPSVKLSKLTPPSIQKKPSNSNLNKPLPNPRPTSPAHERMMDGRPCKDNNYWGFCKGAWATREEIKKGLALETRPEGMYSTSQIWQCKHCCFEGASFSVPHPTKKNKKDVVVDPNIHVSAVGIRYRWAFLAKSHVKKVSYVGAKPAGAKKSEVTDGEVNYGCVVCSVEGNVTGIYGNVETLMNHVYMEHVRPGNMSEQTMARSKCIMGRTAGADEEWDINVPMQDVLLF